jgi:hypothetical protein
MDPTILRVFSTVRPGRSSFVTMAVLELDDMDPS